MRPIWFEGCFGAFHASDRTGPGPRRAAILCGPVGAEADFSGRAWRALAEQLAAAGVAALRLDYRGTRDALDLAPGASALRSWIDSIKAADRWLRDEIGAREISLIGLRLGGALAVVAAQEMGGLERLVLLAPVASGAAYRREWTMMNRIGGLARALGATPAAGDLDFTAETLADLEHLRPARATVAPAARVLVVPRPGVAGDRALIEPLRRQGAEVEEASFDGYAALMVKPEAAAAPQSVFTRVVAWMEGEAPLYNSAAAPPRSPARTAVPGGEETALFFRERAPLFGVAACPDRPEPGAPGLIFLNTGAIGRAGMSGIWVSMARHLAARGLASLRFDISGVGDSDSQEGREAAFERIDDAAADVSAAIDWMRGHGCARIVLVGFCRGARVAFNTALIDPRIDGLVLINPRRLFWAPEAPSPPMRGMRGYIRAARDPRTWRRLARGRIPLGAVASIPSSLVQWSRETRPAQGPDAALRALRSLHDRGVEILWVQGAEDPYLADLEDYFGAPRERFGELFGLRAGFLPGVDHMLRGPEERASLEGVIAEHLMARAPGPIAANESPPISPTRSASGFRTSDGSSSRK